MQVNEIGKWYKPWFFKHVHSFLITGKTGSEVIPLRDYFHRHTRSIFWELQVFYFLLRKRNIKNTFYWDKLIYSKFYFQDIVPFGNNWLFRLVLGWLMPPKISFLKLTQSDAVKRLYENNHIIQDMLVPISSLRESINLFDKEVKVVFCLSCSRAQIARQIFFFRRCIPFGCVLSICRQNPECSVHQQRECLWTSECTVFPIPKSTFGQEKRPGI